MAKHLIQILLLGTRAVGKAFVSALRQEYIASQAAAAARQGGGHRNCNANEGTSKRHGISVEEARQILNMGPEESSPDDVQKRFEQLFKINDTKKGGSFYIQSKVYRAKERLDEHLRIEKQG
ncbi:Mitochondrial import inner membrane translocase subunit tim16-B [Orchesella cincta]|uniref:Mitochondrial import inner membrane translocase subunit tim16-B n=1 Tax=Orchesella cincta TaxID=48709 RepID=A0A1D2MJN7_ORCCI|nr:Mitochondrial import inner membrane translocase subunit tim16-B [Orchesella cincta]